MPHTLTLNIEDIAEALKTTSREDKVHIADLIEQDLLSEWDSYEESKEVKTRVNEAFTAYKAGESVPLRDIMKNEL